MASALALGVGQHAAFDFELGTDIKEIEVIFIA